MDDLNPVWKRRIGKRALILIALAVVYLISFFLPIFTPWHTPGYDGARFAFVILGEGLESFVGSSESRSAWMDSRHLAQAFVQIFIGSVNILFVFGFIFLTMRSLFSYYLATSCAVNMVYWGLCDWDKPLNVGYYLWAICGAALLVLSAREYVARRNVRYVELLYKPVSLSLYLPLVFLVLTWLLVSR